MKSIKMERQDGDNLTVTFDDGTTEQFHGIRSIKPGEIGKPFNDGSAVVLVQDEDTIDPWIIDRPYCLRILTKYLAYRNWGRVPVFTVCPSFDNLLGLHHR